MEALFALLLTYHSQPGVNDFLRVDFETAAACMESVDNLITAEEERPVAPPDTIKWAFCVDSQTGRPILSYRGILDNP